MTSETVTKEFCEKVQELQANEIKALKQYIDLKFQALNKSFQLSASAIGLIVLVLDFLMRFM